MESNAILLLEHRMELDVWIQFSPYYILIIQGKMIYLIYEPYHMGHMTQFVSLQDKSNWYMVPLVRKPESGPRSRSISISELLFFLFHLSEHL